MSQQELLRRAGKKPTVWHVYAVRTVEGYLYTGVATDVARRYAEHASRGPRSAKYLRAHPAASLAFSQKIGSRSLALKVEYRFKQLTKREKERYVKLGRLGRPAQWLARTPKG